MDSEWVGVEKGGRPLKTEDCGKGKEQRKGVKVVVGSKKGGERAGIGPLWESQRGPLCVLWEEATRCWYLPMFYHQGGETRTTVALYIYAINCSIIAVH